MKNFLVLVLLALGFTNCKKAIESVQEDLVIKAMTSGQWKVTTFKQDNADVTGSFSPYVFQFKSDNTVEAITNGAVETKGSWQGNAADKTIVSSFNNGNATVQLLNGTWNITKNSWTYVEATQTVNGEVRTLRLDKN